MATEINRRSFLRGRVHVAESPTLFPPGAHPERFFDLCQDCSRCVAVCPEGIIAVDDAGFAALDFSRGGCTFCGACIEACPTGALTAENVRDFPWHASITSACLSRNGVTCRSCQDVCDAQAIRFRLQTGGRAEPLLDLDACTGCGACASSCPVGAIEFTRSAQSEPPEAAA